MDQSMDGIWKAPFHRHGIKKWLSCQPKNGPCPVHGMRLESIDSIWNPYGNSRECKDLLIGYNLFSLRFLNSEKASNSVYY